MIIDRPPGFMGHNASFNLGFATTFGGCMHDFIESGLRAGPCVRAG
jgi:hypothetical protein